MKYREVATLSVRTATAAAALPGIRRHAGAQGGRGTLCAVWTAEIGSLNGILIVRAFDEQDIPAKFSLLR